jgi:signal transduction histidine kinase/CheY-like chemotaxis protein
MADLKTASWFEVFAGRPLVSLTMRVQGHPLVDIDCYTGPKEVVKHLITAHGCKKLGFIRGPEDHIKAEERFKGYLDAHRECGLEADERLITPPGEFSRVVGSEAVKILFDERKLAPGKDIDGLVTASDNMLISAIEELAKRGIAVPEQLAAASTNSTLEGRNFSPSLTSVYNPFDLQVEAAFTTLLSIIKGESVPETITVPGFLLLNRSCGCRYSEIEKSKRNMLELASARNAGKVRKNKLRRAEIKTVPSLVEQIMDEIELGIRIPDESIRLVSQFTESFYDALKQDSPKVFLDYIDEMLLFISENEGTVEAVQGAITILRRDFFESPHQAETERFAEEIFHSARVAVSEMIRRQDVEAGIRASRLAASFRRLGTRLISSFGLAPLLTMLHDSLKEMGLPSFYLCLYDTMQEYRFPNPLPEWSRLIFAMKGDEVSIDAVGKRFKTEILLPEGLWDRDSRSDLILIPLIFHTQHIGYSISEFGPLERNLYTALMEELSSAIMGSFLLEEREKTALLTSELLQSEKLTILGQLAGGVAHDFNNQLTAILAYADLISNERSLPAHVREYASVIVSAARRSAELTGKLLAFARKGKYKVVPVDVHRLIAETVMLLEHSIDKRIVVRQHLSAFPHWTLGDPVQLDNMLINLAVNARDAMPHGGELSFATEVVTLNEKSAVHELFRPEAGRYVAIIVGDTGIGMDEEIRKHLFEPFFTTKPPGKGTGMGLAAIFGTIKNHGGAMAVESALGKGSRFTIYLPVYAGEVPPDTQPSNEIVPQSCEARVLVVDDNTELVELTSTFLSAKGYLVESELSPLRALKRFQDNPFGYNLVIIDLVMPEMNGIELANSMRTINPTVRILVTSGYALNDTEEGWLSQYEYGFLNKPYTMASLLETVQALIDQGQD